MEINKDALKSMLSVDPGFDSLDEPQKEKFINSVKSYDDVKNLLNQTDGFSDLDTETQDKFIERVTPKPRHYTLGVIGDMIDKTGGSLINSASGLVRGAGELAIKGMGTMMSIGGIEDNSEINKDTQNVQKLFNENIINPVKNYGQGLQKNSQAWENQNLGAKGKFATDVADLALKTIPFIVANIYTGGAEGAIAFHQALAFALEGAGAKYNQARDVGYSPIGAGTRALGTAAVQGLSERFLIGDAYKLGNKALKNVVKTSLRGFGAGAGMTTTEKALDFTADYVANKLDEKLDRGGLTGNEDATDTIKDILRGGALGLVNAGGMATLGEMSTDVKLRLKGQKRVYLNGPEKGQGQYVAVDEFMPRESIEGIGNLARDLSKDNGLPIGANFNALYQGVKANIAINQEVTQAKVKQNLENPLDYLTGPKGNALPDNYNIGSIVGVLPTGNPRIQVKNGATINTPLKATIVEVNPHGTFDVQVETSTGETMILPNVNKEFLVDYSLTMDRIKKNAPKLENIGFVKMLENVVTRGRPLKDLTPEEQHLALGGFFKIVDKFRNGAYGRSKKGRFSLIWDSAREKPQLAPRILAHEVGHFLLEGSPKELENMGLSRFTGFAELLKNKINGKNKLAIRNKYKESFNIIKQHWTLYPSQNKMSTNELLAEAISAFLNKPRPDVNDPITQTKLYDDFTTWIEHEPALKQSWNLMGDLLENRIKSDLNKELINRWNQIDDVLTQKIGRDERKTGMKWSDILSSWLLKEAQPLFNEIQRTSTNKESATKAINAIDAFKLSGENTSAFIKEIESEMSNLGINPDDAKTYLFHNRILSGGRTKNVYLEEGIDPLGLAKEVKQQLKSEGVEITSETIEKRMNELIKEFIPQVVKEQVDLLNMMQIDKEQSAKSLAEIKGKLGDEDYAKLEKFAHTPHKSMMEWFFPFFESSDLYTTTQLNKIKNTSDYATFNVIKHSLVEKVKKGLGINKAPGMFTQQGSTSDIENPLTATLNQWTSMYMSARRKAIVRDTLEYLEATGSKFVRRLPDNSMGYVYEGKDKEVITVYRTHGEKTETKHYLVDSLLMKTFHSEDLSGMLNAFSKASVLFKQGLTLYNPSFWLYNFARDTDRSFFNAPGSLLERMKTLPDVFQIGYKTFKENRRGETSELRKELTKLELLTGGTHGQKGRKEQIIQRMKGITEGRQAHKSIIKWYQKLLEDIGDATEFANPAAWYLHMKRLNKGGEVTPEQLNMLRNEIGSPIFSHKAGEAWLRNIILFYNPTIQGYLSDYNNYKRNKSAFLAKRMSVLMMKNLALYLFAHDSDNKQALQGITNQEWSRKWFIPLGITTDGTPLTLSLPMGETTQILNSLTVNTLLRPLMESQHMSFLQGAKVGVENVVSNVPQVNPMLKVPWKLTEFLEKGNITNSFTGRKVIPDRIKNSNNDAMKMAYVAKYIYDSTGLLPSLYRFNFSTQDFPIANRESSIRRKVLDVMKMTQHTIIGRFIRVGGYGYTETSKRLATHDLYKKNDNVQFIQSQLSELANLYANNKPIPQNLKKELIQSAKTDPKYFKYQLRNMLKIMAMQRTLTKLNATNLNKMLENVTRARNKPERDAALNIMFKTYNQRASK